MAKSQTSYNVTPVSSTTTNNVLPNVMMPPSIPVPSATLPPPLPGAALTDLPDNQKALIQQVLSLTPEQIEKLPLDVIYFLFPFLNF
jgi:hypothetical protein